jgi:NADH:ubiquinone oxidoreductase subunit E
MTDLNKTCCGEKSACTCHENSKSDNGILPNEILDFIKKCGGDAHPESQLIAVLHKAQDHFGYLSPEIMDAVAYLMQIPAAKISGVASFYHYFHLTPRGKFTINVCMGTACYVKGAEAVLNKFREELGIELGETTKDGVFSLQQERCLGTCALAPVVKVGEKIYSQVTPDQVPIIINHFVDIANNKASVE